MIFTAGFQWVGCFGFKLSRLILKVLQSTTKRCQFDCQEEENKFNPITTWDQGHEEGQMLRAKCLASSSPRLPLRFHSNLISAEETVLLQWEIF